MNLSGILVVAARHRSAEVRAALEALPGVEVHHADPAAERLVIVQEAEDINAEVEGLRRIKAVPGVVMAEMVYHYIADDDGTYTELPDGPGLRQAPDAVPAFLAN